MSKNHIKLFILLGVLMAGSVGTVISALGSGKPAIRLYFPLVQGQVLTSFPVWGFIPIGNTPGNPPIQPNLRPYAPPGWSDPIVPAAVQGALTTGALFAGKPTYINWVVLNEGLAPASGQVSTCLYLDGVEIGRWHASDQPQLSYAYVGDWAYPINRVGPYTLRLQADCTDLVVESDETDNFWQKTFYWQPAMQVSPMQGFDACTAPSLSQMDAWWRYSPYYNVNIYIGGISRGCTQPELKPEWIQAVTTQGWNLIPTWVGPQAPCSPYKNKFSNVPATAHTQGRAEADAAIAVAANLGLTGVGKQGTVIYYDLEAYNTSDLACRTAVSEFISGWSARMRETGNRAGVYGTSNSISYMAALPNVPDDIWAAQWKPQPYQYDPTVSVWNLYNISNELWKDHQRIRQYTGGHNETYGLVTINIDSNALDGHVVGVTDHAVYTGTLTAPLTPQAPGMQIADFSLLAPKAGWALMDGALLWGSADSLGWQDISPPGREGTVLAAQFLTPAQGWAVARGLQTQAGENSLQIFSTADGGVTWQENQLNLGAPEVHGWSDRFFLHFLDSRRGWLVARQASSLNFRLGRLFHTQDGGRTWQELSIPIGEPVQFLNPQVGFVSGGAAGNEQYRTSDGGRTWLPIETAPPTAKGQADPLRARLAAHLAQNGGLAGEIVVSTPDNKSAWATAAVTHCDGVKTSLTDPLNCSTQTQLWRTMDSGHTWTQVR